MYLFERFLGSVEPHDIKDDRAQISKKVLGSEDLLTSDVLGLARYLPASAFLRPLLREVARSSGEFSERLDRCATSTKWEVRFWPPFDIPHSTAKRYGDQHTCIPDAALYPIDDGGTRSREFVLFEESKFRSPVDLDELVRECAAGVHWSGAAPFFLLVITPHQVDPIRRDELSRRLTPLAEVLTLKPQEFVRRRVLWLGWRRVARLIERETVPDLMRSEPHSEFAACARRFVGDLLNVLAQKGIRAPFELDARRVLTLAQHLEAIAAAVRARHGGPRFDRRTIEHRAVDRGRLEAGHNFWRRK